MSLRKLGLAKTMGCPGMEGSVMVKLLEGSELTLLLLLLLVLLPVNYGVMETTTFNAVRRRRRRRISEG